MALVTEERPADGKRISGFGARYPLIRFAKQSAGRCLRVFTCVRLPVYLPRATSDHWLRMSDQRMGSG